MKKVICLVTVLSIVVLMGAKQPCCATKEAQCATAEKAILATHDQIVTAAEKLDAETMFSYILENDKGAIIQDGRLFTRQQSMDSVKQSFAGTTNVKYNFQQRNVKMLSPTIALFTGTGNVTVTIESGESFTSEFANTSVFVLQNKEWKIIHGHHSIPNPRP